MNWPNALTLLRIFAAPLLLVALLHYPFGDIFAAALFVLAAVSDSMDGYLARRFNQVTRFGKLIDPVADKLLVAAALLALVQVGRLPSWVAWVIIGRELAVTGLRSVAAAEGLVISASVWGKAKTVTQVVAITMMIVADNRLLAWVPLLPLLTVLALWVAVVFTLYSGFEYAYRYWRGTRADSAPGA